MNILITGGTGFIGTQLHAALSRGMHTVYVLSRSARGEKFISDLDQLPQDIKLDVVINLAGEPIADRRWTTSQKQSIQDSRLGITSSLIDYFRSCEHKPAVFISGSAIGYYGIKRDDEPVDEDAAGDDSFSSQLCQQWEALASQASQFGIRTCLLRTGIVLGKGGGALSKMLLPFRLGLGGRIGCGDQWMPWIHMQDMVGIILYCIEHEEISGAVNATAPQPVTNKMFTRLLGSVLHRPTLLPMPAFMVRLLMGQMGEELLLSGRRVMPCKMLEAGYQFKCANLEHALQSVI